MGKVLKPPTQAPQRSRVDVSSRLLGKSSRIYRQQGFDAAEAFNLFMRATIELGDIPLKIVPRPVFKNGLEQSLYEESMGLCTPLDIKELEKMVADAQARKKRAISR